MRRLSRERCPRPSLMTELVIPKTHMVGEADFPKLPLTSTQALRHLGALSPTLTHTKYILKV